MSAALDPGPWIFSAFLALGVLVLVLVLATVMVWTLGSSRSARLMRRRRTWEEAVLGFYAMEDRAERQRAAGDLAAALTAQDRESFAVFIMEYLVELQGEDADRLRELLRFMEFEHHAAELLHSRSSWKRAVAARLLGEMPSPRTRDLLLVAARDGDPAVSFAAALGLLKRREPGMAVTVYDALEDREDWTPGQIKELLIQGGTPLAAHLHARLGRPGLSEARTKIIIDLLGHLRYLPAAAAMISLLRGHPSPETRISLLRALGRLEAIESLPDVLADLRHPDWVVRSQAALALGRLGDPAAVSALFVALNDGSYWVRYNAAIALSRLGRPGQKVLLGVARSGGTVATLAQEVLMGRGAA